MKKIIGLLLISLTVCLNIDGVRSLGESYTGTCEIVNNGSNSCQYKCNVTHDSSYLNFYYNVNLVDNQPDHSVEFIGTDGGCKLFIDKNCAGFNVMATEARLDEYPNRVHFFDKGDVFTCSPVYTEISISENVTTSMDGSWSTYHVTNAIKVLADKDLPGFSTGTDPSNNVCGLLGDENSEIVTLIKKIYNLIKIAIPILVVALSIADFIKVVISGKDDDMKKAISKLVKRIIIAIVFVVLPFIIQVMINISGVSSMYDGLNDGLKSIFCILG